MTDTSNIDFNALFERCRAEHEERCRRIAERRAVCKAALFDAFAAADITLVFVDFDGEGDNGQIDDITARAGDTVVALPDAAITFIEPSYQDEPARPRTLEIRDAIEELVYEALEETHAGWQDNDGAYGDFTFDVAARTIELDYNERHMESDNSYHEF